MVNINKSTSLNQLRELVKKNIKIHETYLPDGFYEEQKKAIDIFNKRIFLENIIDKTILFNKKLTWNYENKNLKLTTTAEELVEVFKLRSDVFTEIAYQNEFPDTIKGLNFDIYDTSSAVIYYKNNNIVSGTIRLVFDSKNKLPSEKEFSFNNIRQEYNTIGEISRNMVKNRGQGLNQEFKYLMCGVYNIFLNNNIDIAVSGIKKDHLKLFKKLGGVNVVKELKYGTFKESCLIISYNPKQASKFFRKVFLKE